MTELFLKIVNMSISASWLVLAVLLLRFALKKAPKWVNVLLWAIVAVRLICPFSFESALSLIPSAETISPNIMMEKTPTIQSGVPAINSVVNPVIGQSFAPNPGDSANPLQILIPIIAIVWAVGIAALLAYTAISYWRLRRKVSEAVILQDNIFQSENVASPFVLGIVKPRIYLPYHMGEQDLTHVVAHEQAHIRRRDHWWKPLGFLLLTIHWFNPLMWLAYVLLCRDIELACDEKVIKDLGNEQRADYTQALVSCSVNRRMIAACPLAFGEVGVKERVKSVMNYKKPAFWIVAIAVIACVVVAVCFLTNPRAEREFPINGDNVSELNTMQIVSKIADAENLDDGSLLCVNADNFDLMFTPDFNWANDGAIRFFYTERDQIYSAQLRMFHDDNKYFITERSKWIEQEQSFKLIHYLDALKYMPQEEIRLLSPDADGYSVIQVHDGVPGDYGRVLKYSQNGVEDIDGWYIHLTVQPLHQTPDGSYNGSGDEVIHLFYGHPDLVMLENNSVTKWFDYTDNPAAMEDELTTELPEFPGVTFTYNGGQIIASKPFDDSMLTGNTILISGMPIWNAYFADLTGDGYPEICATYSFGSGIIDTRFVVYDYVNGASYEMADRGNFDYSLRLNESDGYLYVDKRAYNSNELVSFGRLAFENDGIVIAKVMDNGASLLPQKYPEYFGLDASNGLDVYVWQMAANSYSFGLLPHADTERDWIAEELMNLKGADASEMRTILETYNLDETEIHIIPWQNPYSSYIADVWIFGDDVSQEEKQVKYVEQIRNMLFPSEEVASAVETDPTEHPVPEDNGNSTYYTVPLDPNKTLVDLTQGSLTVKAEELGDYIFYTNSTKIAVKVTSSDTAKASVMLHSLDSGDDFILIHELDGDDDCAFTHLTSAQYYTLSTENLSGCEITVSEDQSFVDKIFG